ncbi:uncharacterized protein TNCV_4244841 [Trichonephila clavipes]|nr:uncharacterized protein TNCV_4244841 [Trichonephila clavipes]
MGCKRLLKVFPPKNAACKVVFVFIHLSVTGSCSDITGGASLKPVSGQSVDDTDAQASYRTVACLVTGSSPVPPKTHRVGQRCTLNLSRAEPSSRWCGVVVRRGGCQLRCRPRHLTMVQNYVVRHQKALV